MSVLNGLKLVAAAFPLAATGSSKIVESSILIAAALTTLALLVFSKINSVRVPVKFDPSLTVTQACAVDCPPVL